MPSFTIRVAHSSDAPALGRLRAALWPDAPAEQHEREVARAIGQGASGTMPAINFVAEAPNGEIVGFVEVGLRSHADGCDPAHPVGFVEGWFVSEPHRRAGVGRALLAAAEQWARAHGCREMASDTPVENEPSQQAHRALGYEVVDRCVNYRKPLDPA